MSTKLTKNELITLNSELSAKNAHLGGRVVDLEKENATLRDQLNKFYAGTPARFNSREHLDTVRKTAQQLCAQYGHSNVRRVGGQFRVRTPNGAWNPVS